MVAKRILLVDDDRLVLESLGDWLTSQGYTVATASGVEEALEIMEKEKLQLILTDIRLGSRSGLELLSMSRCLSPPAPVILMSGYATLDTGIEAIRAGAFDLLRKPVMDEELSRSIDRALDPQQATPSQPPRLRLPTEVIGHDSTLHETFGVIDNVADTKTTILITGESGTGKSLIARSIHRQSRRRDRPFVEVACGALTETLLESELFGHVTGAFTGAVADKQGKFAQAQGGTIFLDEISTASARMQVKLLRVLQEFKFEAVGGTQTHEADTRVILATNDDLDQAVEDGKFRRDLYYRVNVIKLEIPPLRERVMDIATLCDHFLALVCRETGKPLARFNEVALTRLRQHHWPGNVRELQNVVERAVLLSSGGEIGPADLPNELLHDNVTRSSLYSCGETLKEALERPERQIIRQALEDANGNRSQAAEALGINRTTLYKKMKRLGLDNDPSRTAPLDLPIEVDQNAVSSP